MEKEEGQPYNVKEIRDANSEKVLISRIVSQLKKIMKKQVTNNTPQQEIAKLYHPDLPTHCQEGFHSDPYDVRLIVGKSGSGRMTASIAEGIYLSSIIGGNRGAMFVENPGVVFGKIRARLLQLKLLKKSTDIEKMLMLKKQ